MLSFLVGQRQKYNPQKVGLSSLGYSMLIFRSVPRKALLRATKNPHSWQAGKGETKGHMSASCFTDHPNGGSPFHKAKCLPCGNHQERGTLKKKHTHTCAMLQSPYMADGLGSLKQKSLQWFLRILPTRWMTIPVNGTFGGPTPASQGTSTSPGAHKRAQRGTGHSSRPRQAWVPEQNGQ